MNVSHSEPAAERRSPAEPSTGLPDRDILRGLIGSVLVEGAVHFQPQGAILLPQLEAVWHWLNRDIDTSLSIGARKLLAAPDASSEISAFCLAISTLLMQQVRLAADDHKLAHDIRVQIGDDNAYANLEKIAMAFKCQPFLPKALAFGRSLNQQREDAALALSLKSFPAKQSPLMPFIMHAAMSQISQPARIVGAIINLAEGSGESEVLQAGYGAIVDALLAHAQNQISLIYDDGPFTDMDLACQAVARFHALIRGVSIITENSPQGRWAQQVSKLIAHISDRLEPRIARIEVDVRQSLRLPRSEKDHLDTGLLLEALSGMYLLSTIRESRESLGVNSALETAWTQTGQVLEILIERNLEAFKSDPSNELTARRLDAAINMARIRFNPEYADIVKRAMDSAARRGTGTSH